MKGKDIYFLQYDMFGYQSISIGVIDIAAGMYFLFSLLMIATTFAFFFLVAALCLSLISFLFALRLFPIRLI